jgi:hypothetical protein
MLNLRDNPAYQARFQHLLPKVHEVTAYMDWVCIGCCHCVSPVNAFRVDLYNYKKAVQRQKENRHFSGNHSHNNDRLLYVSSMGAAASARRQKQGYEQRLFAQSIEQTFIFCQLITSSSLNRFRWGGFHAASSLF